MPALSLHWPRLAAAVSAGKPAGVEQTDRLKRDDRADNWLAEPEIQDVIARHLRAFDTAEHYSDFPGATAESKDAKGTPGESKVPIQRLRRLRL